MPYAGGDGETRMARERGGGEGGRVCRRVAAELNSSDHFGRGNRTGLVFSGRFFEVASANLVLADIFDRCCFANRPATPISPPPHGLNVLLRSVGPTYPYPSRQRRMMGRLPTRNRQAVPRLATSLKGMRVTSISAGYAHSVAVTDEGRAFAGGQNDRGQVNCLRTSQWYVVAKLVMQTVTAISFASSPISLPKRTECTYSCTFS